MMDLLTMVADVIGKAASTHLDVMTQAIRQDPNDMTAHAAFRDALEEQGIQTNDSHPTTWGWDWSRATPDSHRAYMEAVDHFNHHRLLARFPEHPRFWEQSSTEEPSDDPGNWSHPHNVRHGEYDDVENRHMVLAQRFDNSQVGVEAAQRLRRGRNSPRAIERYNREANDWLHRWSERAQDQRTPRHFMKSIEVKIFTRKAAPPDATSAMDNTGRILDYFGLTGHVRPNAGHPSTWDGFQGAVRPDHSRHEAYRAAVRQHQHEMEMQHFPSRIAEPPRTIEEPAPYQDIAPGAMWDWRYENHPRYQEWRDASLHHMEAHNAFGRSQEYANFQDNPAFHGDDPETIAASNREYARIANRWYQEQHGQPGSTTKMFAKAAPHLPVVARMLIEDPSDAAAAAALHDTLDEEDIARPMRGVHPSRWPGFENAHLPDHPHHEAYDAAAMRHYHETGVAPSWEHPSRWPGFAAEQEGGMDAAHPSHPRHGEYALAARDYHANWRQHMADYFPHSPYDWHTSTHGIPNDDPNHWSHEGHPDNPHFQDALTHFHAAHDAYARHLSPGAWGEATQPGDWAREMAMTRAWSRAINNPEEANAWYRQHMAQGGDS